MPGTRTAVQKGGKKFGALCTPDASIVLGSTSYRICKLIMTCKWAILHIILLAIFNIQLLDIVRFIGDNKISGSQIGLCWGSQGVAEWMAKPGYNMSCSCGCHKNRMNKKVQRKQNHFNSEYGMKK